LPKELVSRTLIRKVARPKRVYTIKRQISAWKKKKKYNENLRDCNGTLKDESLLLMSGNEFTIAHYNWILKQ
jgi:hypothetical protein